MPEDGEIAACKVSKVRPSFILTIGENEPPQINPQTQNLNRLRIWCSVAEVMTLEDLDERHAYETR